MNNTETKQTENKILTNNNQRPLEFRFFSTWWMHFVEQIDFVKQIVLTTDGDYRKISEGYLMQYTGKKDKIWKKIYEGDIVDTWKFEWILVIEYDFCEFLWWRNGLGVKIYDICKFWKVIWNIYENNELIK